MYKLLVTIAAGVLLGLGGTADTAMAAGTVTGSGTGTTTGSTSVFCGTTLLQNDAVTVGGNQNNPPIIAVTSGTPDTSGGVTVGTMNQSVPNLGEAIVNLVSMMGC